MALQKFMRFSAAIMALAALLSGSPAAAQTPVRVGGDIKEPVRTRYIAPVYPAIALQAKVQARSSWNW